MNVLFLCKENENIFKPNTDQVIAAQNNFSEKEKFSPKYFKMDPLNNWVSLSSPNLSSLSI